jgi:hypothetical protein
MTSYLDSKKIALCLGLLTLSSACGPQVPSTSQPLVTSVQHTKVKRQSIGNCWIYAQATWLEALTLRATGKEIDVSESYWTYWHFYNQLMAFQVPSKIETGGFWWTANDILTEHGYMLEGDFIPAESRDEMSKKQVFVEESINQGLKDGSFDSLFWAPEGTAPASQGQRFRTSLKGIPIDGPTRDRNVRALLDRLFGVDMATLEGKALKAEDARVIQGPNGKLLPVTSAFEQGERHWTNVTYPYMSSANPTEFELSQLKRERKKVLDRVKRALNDHMPVVMSLNIDFNGLDPADATFKADFLRSKGPGSQGAHMVVLSDYTVSNVPGIGVLGKGEMSADLKTKALLGDVSSLVAKNSWGTNRPERGLTDGYTSFDINYLNDPWTWKDFDGTGADAIYPALTDFELPPGY